MKETRKGAVLSIAELSKIQGLLVWADHFMQDQSSSIGGPLRDSIESVASFIPYKKETAKEAAQPSKPAPKMVEIPAGGVLFDKKERQALMRFVDRADMALNYALQPYHLAKKFDEAIQEARKLICGPEK